MPSAGGLGEANGRMYAPTFSCFLSPDNYIQSPDFSQSFNRYAYCLNNPLKYVDPSGEWIQYVIGTLVALIVAMLAVLWQSLKTANTNLVEALKKE